MSIHNYTVVGHFTDNGHRIRTGRLSFYAEPTCNVGERQALANQRLQEFFVAIRRPGTETTSTEIRPLKLKLGASLNTQHDYITLRCSFNTGKGNFTTSYGGQKASGVLATRDYFRRLARVVDTLGKSDRLKNWGAVMAKLCELANANHDVEQFLLAAEKEIA